MVSPTQIKGKPKKSDFSESEISLPARVASPNGMSLSEEEASFELKLKGEKAERVLKEIEKETRSR